MDYESAVNPAFYWEMIKMKVREKPMKYASARKKDLYVERSMELEQAMTELLNTTNNPNITNEQKRDAEEKLEICKNEHEKIIEQHTKA